MKPEVEGLEQVRGKAGMRGHGKRGLTRRGRGGRISDASFVSSRRKTPTGGFEVQSTMRVASGTVIDGKVVVEGESLVEGSTVTVFLPEPDEEIELTPDEESRLAHAVREADEGDFLEEDGEQFLDELDRRL